MPRSNGQSVDNQTGIRSSVTSGQEASSDVAKNGLILTGLNRLTINSALANHTDPSIHIVNEFVLRFTLTSIKNN